MTIVKGADSWFPCLLVGLGLGLGVGVGTGCATSTARPRVEVYPEAGKGKGKVEWRGGQGVVTQEQGGVRIGAVFDFATRDLLAFELTVENLTDAPLTIDPRRTYCATCTTAKDCPTAAPVLGPDLILADLERKKAREQASAEDDLMLGTVVLLLSTPAEVTNLATGHVRRQPALLSSDAVAATQMALVAHEVSARRIDDQQKKWSGAALRLTTLAPGERLAGYVFVPLDQQARFVWLDVLAAGQRFSFRFEQFLTGQTKTAPQHLRRASDPPE